MCEPRVLKFVSFQACDDVLEDSSKKPQKRLTSLQFHARSSHTSNPGMERCIQWVAMIAVVMCASCCFNSRRLLLKIAGISFQSMNPSWRNLRKIFTMEVLSPKRLQVWQPVRAKELNHTLTSIFRQSNKHPNSPLEVRAKLWVLTTNVTSEMIDLHTKLLHRLPLFNFRPSLHGCVLAKLAVDKRSGSYKVLAIWCERGARSTCVYDSVTGE